MRMWDTPGRETGTSPEVRSGRRKPFEKFQGRDWGNMDFLGIFGDMPLKGGLGWVCASMLPRRA